MFLSYIHELATGEPDADFDSEIARYVPLHKEFMTMRRALRDAGTRWNWQSFYELELHIERRMAHGARPSSQVRIVAQYIARYRSVRAQLLVGPDPLARK